VCSSDLTATAAPASFPEYLVDAAGRVVVREPALTGSEGSSIAGSTLMRAILGEASGSVLAQAGDGDPLEYTFRPVNLEPDGGLYLAIGYSPAQLFAPERRILWMTLAGFAMVAVAALAAAWGAGTRWVYEPTRRLRDAAMKIGKGKLSVRAHLATGIEEFTALGDQFDAMAESIERRATLGIALTEVNTIAHSTLEFDEVMQRIISVTCDAVGTETAAVVLREHGMWVTKYSYNFQQEIAGVILTDEQAPHAAMALRSGRPVAIDDAYNDPRLNRDVMVSYGIRSVLTMPLIVQDEVIGVLFMNHHSAATAFSVAQIDFAASVAATVSLALQNARLYEGEHRIAQTLQQSLLALPDSVPHVRFARVYRSATEAARVGGDFYDLFEIEHDRVGVTIGDVSGKGLDAAVLTSMIKNTIRAQATDPGKTPAEVLRTTNIVFLRSSQPEVFATVFFGLLDTSTGRLSYCNAGHTAGVVRDPGGAVTLLPSNSTLVGGLPDAVFENAEARLAPGALLFLHTDGVTEARRDHELFGTRRVLDLIGELESGDPWVAAARVAQSAAEFAGGRLTDDLAILAVELADR
jgi:serine phosphatase RsbU (regulator of sigma subunit)/HAMP domain-containing protein